MRGMPRANMVGTMNQLTAIILAAGEAKRMRSARPKVLHPLCGRPLIAYPLGAAGALGARVVVVVGRAAEEVRAAVAPEIGAERVDEQPVAARATKTAKIKHPPVLYAPVRMGDSRL